MKKQNTIYPFTAKTLPQLSEVGGKAQSLIKMAQQNFPVPDGFVLTVKFFEPWLTAVQSKTSWKAFLNSPEKDVKATCDAVKKSCASLKFNAEQKAELEKALQKLPKNSYFAVRSSSPEEDLEGTSFAGGYETTLGVTHNALEKAILHSFTSVFDERIVNYKQQHGMCLDQPKIAVIVQEQIASQVSGVAFSLNPQNNNYDEAVINANFGLGETIVAGQVTPDTYVVEKVKQEILEKKIARKDHALWLTDKGGTQKRDNPHPSQSSLTDKQVKAVAKLVTQVEQHYGKPMDIEWAYAQKRLFLLQARPITAYLPLPPGMVTRPGEPKLLFSDQLLIKQGLDRSLSILGGDLFLKLTQGLGFQDFGKDVYGLKDGIFYVEAGRVYAQLSNLYKLLGQEKTAFVGGAGDYGSAQILRHLDFAEYAPKLTPKKLRGLLLGMVKMVWRFVLPGVGAYFKPKKALQKYQNQVHSIEKTFKALEAQSGTFGAKTDASFSWLMWAMRPFFSLLWPPIVARWRMKKLFKKKNVSELLVQLEMALPGNPTSEMGKAMYALAAHPDLQACKTRSTFLKKLEKKAFSPSFLKAWTKYMNRFGFRSIREIDLATPRPNETPGEFFEQLKTMALVKKGEETVFETSERKQKQAYRKLLRLAQKMGKEKAFKKNADLIRTMAGYREAPKYYMVMMLGHLRSEALKLADQWVQEGRLKHRGDLFKLTLNDIDRGEKDPSFDLRQAIAHNTTYWAKVSDRTDWPKVFDSRGKIFRAPLVSTDSNALIGEPIAQGVVRGKAKVLSSPYEKPLKKGEILVTRATDPGWTPLFMNAAAIVLEIGGALQHGAIIAREYGLPCVSGLDGATQRINDGDLLEVDGSHGVVRILNETASPLPKSRGGGRRSHKKSKVN